MQADIGCAAVRAPPAGGAGNQKEASAPAAAVRGWSPSSAPDEEVREAAGGSNAAVDSRRGARDGAGATVELMEYTKRTAAQAKRSCTNRGGVRMFPPGDHGPRVLLMRVKSSQEKAPSKQAKTGNH